MESKVFLFPLPGSLTLPKVALPFHIFEPRYRAMINAALEQEIPVAVIPPLSHNYSGRVCYGGVPQLLQRYEDGRMDIAIAGDVRCRLGEMLKTEPYLVSEYEAEDEDATLSAKSAFARECIHDGLVSWGQVKIPGDDQFEIFKRVIKESESLLSYGTLFLVEEMDQKLKVIEERKWDKRAEMIFKTLGPKEVSLGPFLPPLKWK